MRVLSFTCHEMKFSGAETFIQWRKKEISSYCTLQKLLHMYVCAERQSCFNVSVFIRHDSSDHSRAGVWGWNKRSEPMLNYTPTVSVCYLYLEGLFFQHILRPMSSGWLITGLVWGSVSSSSALQLAERRTSNHRLNNYWMSCSVTWAPVAP